MFYKISISIIIILFRQGWSDINYVGKVKDKASMYNVMHELSALNCYGRTQGVVQ